MDIPLEKKLKICHFLLPKARFFGKREFVQKKYHQQIKMFSDDEISGVVLPKAFKKSSSGKLWWDIDRNRLGETELQRRVIDLKLTDEPQEKLDAILELIQVRGHPVNVADNTGNKIRSAHFWSFFFKCGYFDMKSS